MTDYDIQKVIIDLFKAYLSSNHDLNKPGHVSGTVPADVVKGFLEHLDTQSILSHVLKRLVIKEIRPLKNTTNPLLSFSETAITSAQDTLKEKQEVLDGLMLEWNNPSLMKHRQHASLKSTNDSYAGSLRFVQLCYAASHADEDLLKILEDEIKALYCCDPFLYDFKENWITNNLIVNNRILLAVEIKVAKLDVQKAKNHLNQLLCLQRLANLKSEDETVQFQSLSENGQSCYDDAKQMLLGLDTQHDFLYPAYFESWAINHPNDPVVKTQRSLQAKQTELVSMIDGLIKPLSASTTLFVSGTITKEKRHALIDLKNKIAKVDTYTARPSVFEDVYHQWTTSRTDGNSKTNQELMSSHRNLLSRVIAVFRTVKTATDAKLTQAGFFSLSEDVDSSASNDSKKISYF